MHGPGVRPRTGGVCLVRWADTTSTAPTMASACTVHSGEVIPAAPTRSRREIPPAMVSATNRALTVFSSTPAMRASFGMLVVVVHPALR